MFDPVRTPSLGANAKSDIGSEESTISRLIRGTGNIRPRPTSMGEFTGAKLAGQKLGLARIKGLGNGGFW